MRWLLKVIRQLDISTADRMARRNQETPGYSKVRLITELTTAKSTITGVKAAYDHGQKGSHFKKELIKISDH